MRTNLLIIGYGDYGKVLFESLKDIEKHTFFIAENDKELYEEMQEMACETILFDFFNDEILKNYVKKHNFSKVILAKDNEKDNLYLTITIKSLFPKLEVIALANSPESARKLTLAKATKVIDSLEANRNSIYHILQKKALKEAFDEMVYKPNGIVVDQIMVCKIVPFLGLRIFDVDFKADYDILLLGILNSSSQDYTNDIDFEDLEEEELIIKHVAEDSGSHGFGLGSKGLEHRIDIGDTLIVAGLKEKMYQFKKEMDCLGEYE